jgi:ferric-dicitrate binding protein FerR (iron transport regulator)
MNEERFWLLVSQQLAGEATPEELEELNAYLHQHPEKGLQVEIVRNMWKKEQHIAGAQSKNFNKHLQRLSSHLSQPVMQYETETEPVEEILPPPRRLYRWLLPAISAAAAVVIFFLVFMPRHEKQQLAVKPSPGNTVTTKPGSKSQITLPDGTQVWINADSKITYDQHFPGKYREVHLTGEAYFDVMRDTTRPFIIHTRSIDVRVLGTSFNVRSYPNEKTTETALIHGTVEVTLHKNPAQKIILKPNEKLVVNNEDTADLKENKKDAVVEPTLTLGKIRYNKNDSSSSVETMWVSNKLAFENETFEKMATEMERWYNVSFYIKNEQIKNLHFRAVFENKSLAEVLEALSYSSKFHYEIKDGKVTVW